MEYEITLTMKVAAALNIIIKALKIFALAMIGADFRFG